MLESSKLIDQHLVCVRISKKLTVEFVEPANQSEIHDLSGKRGTYHLGLRV